MEQPYSKVNDNNSSSRGSTELSIKLCMKETFKIFVNFVKAGERSKV